jgi:hypothetical protein
MVRTLFVCYFDFWNGVGKREPKVCADLIFFLEIKCKNWEAILRMEIPNVYHLNLYMAILSHCVLRNFDKNVS